MAFGGGALWTFRRLTLTCCSTRFDKNLLMTFSVLILAKSNSDTRAWMAQERQEIHASMRTDLRNMEVDYPGRLIYSNFFLSEMIKFSFSIELATVLAVIFSMIYQRWLTHRQSKALLKKENPNRTLSFAMNEIWIKRIDLHDDCKCISKKSNLASVKKPAANTGKGSMAHNCFLIPPPCVQTLNCAFSNCSPDSPPPPAWKNSRVSHTISHSRWWRCRMLGLCSIFLLSFCNASNRFFHSSLRMLLVKISWLIATNLTFIS